MGRIGRALARFVWLPFVLLIAITATSIGALWWVGQQNVPIRTPDNLAATRRITQNVFEFDFGGQLPIDSSLRLGDLDRNSCDVQFDFVLEATTKGFSTPAELKIPDNVKGFALYRETLRKGNRTFDGSEGELAFNHKMSERGIQSIAFSVLGAPSLQTYVRATFTLPCASFTYTIAPGQDYFEVFVGYAGGSADGQHNTWSGKLPISVEVNLDASDFLTAYASGVIDGPHAARWRGDTDMEPSGFFQDGLAVSKREKQQPLIVGTAVGALWGLIFPNLRRAWRHGRAGPPGSYITIADAVSQYQVSETTLRTAVRTGSVPSTIVGRLLHVDAKSVASQFGPRA